MTLVYSSHEYCTKPIGRQPPDSSGNIGSVKHREEGRRHRPERGHQDIPPTSDSDRPTELQIANDRIHRRLEPIEELLEWSFHLSHDSFAEASEVSGFQPLRRNDVRNGGKPEIWRRGIGADVAEPLFGDDKGDENIRFC